MGKALQDILASLSPLSLYHTLPQGLEGCHLQDHCQVGLLVLIMWVMTDRLAGKCDLCLKPTLGAVCPGTASLGSRGLLLLAAHGFSEILGPRKEAGH